MTPFGILSLVLLAGSSCLAAPSRIVGGEVTTIDQYPSIVSVEALSFWTGSWGHNCGANIISNLYIVSAAHCFSSPAWNLPNSRIRAGSSYRNTGGSIYLFANILNHPSYGTNGFDADITLIRLQTSLTYSNVIQPIAIPPQGMQVPDGLEVVHAGWGTTIPGVSASASNVLRDVVMYSSNRAACAAVYLTMTPPGIVTNNMICAHYPGGGRDACQGDSGGPLYYSDGNTNILIGIVSWGNSCGHPNFPGVSAAVSSYTNWIVANAV